MKFEGIYTPLVAPFFDDFTLNHDAMQQTVDLLVNAGVHGIIVAGTTGEYYAMSMKERVYMMGVAKEMIAGRVPMIIGTGAIRTEDSVEYARQAKLHDADAILIATPPYAYPTGREIALHALAIDREANLPAMLYNYPGRMSVNMDEECLDRLGRSPNFCAIKESSGIPTVCTCWHVIILISRLAAAWMIRPWNFSHGARAAGSVPDQTLRPRRISPFIRPAQ